MFVDRVSARMPSPRDHTLDHRFLSPAELAAAAVPPKATIAHGDVFVESLFGNRPKLERHDDRTPLRGHYPGCAGFWTGDHFKEVPGFGAGRAVLADHANVGRLTIGAEDAS